MMELMDQIAQARQLFTAQRDGCAAQLDALAEEQAEYAQEQLQSPVSETANFAELQVQCPAGLCLLSTSSTHFYVLRAMPSHLVNCELFQGMH